MKERIITIQDYKNYINNLTRREKNRIKEHCLQLQKKNEEITTLTNERNSLIQTFNALYGVNVFDFIYKEFEKGTF